jgi:hypothetical protein
MHKKIQEKVDVINTLWSTFNEAQKARVRDHMVSLCGFHQTSFYRKLRDEKWTPLEADEMVRKMEEVKATPDLEYRSRTVIVSNP